MILSVATRCACGRQLARIDVGEHAPAHVRRTCRGCRTRWAVAVHPLGPVTGGFAHRADLVRLS